MRKPIIAGNWKMNKLPCEGAELVEALKSKVADAQCEVVVCVPFVDLVAVAAAAKGSNIKVGAQNMHWEKSGAFTGEISADMLKAVGAQYVVLGHSERRQYFAETDETVNKKVLAAVANGLTPINETIGVIRKAIEGAYGKAVADATRIQYGGSMNAKNCAGLMAQPEIDGGLIGGASLKAEDFSIIVAAASATVK